MRVLQSYSFRWFFVFLKIRLPSPARKPVFFAKQKQGKQVFCFLRKELVIHMNRIPEYNINGNEGKLCYILILLINF